MNLPLMPQSSFCLLDLGCNICLFNTALTYSLQAKAGLGKELLEDHLELQAEMVSIGCLI